MRDLHKIAAVSVGQPNGPYTRASGIESDALAIGRVRGFILLEGGGENLCGRGRRTKQVATPDIVAIAAGGKSELVSMEGSGGPNGVRRNGNFLKRAIADANLIKLVRVKIARNNEGIVVRAPGYPGRELLHATERAL